MVIVSVSMVFGAIACVAFSSLMRNTQDVRSKSLPISTNNYYKMRFETMPLRMIYRLFLVLVFASITVLFISSFNLIGGRDILSAPVTGQTSFLSEKSIFVINQLLPTLGFTTTAFLMWLFVEFIRNSNSQTLEMKNYVNSFYILVGLIFSQSVYVFIQNISVDLGTAAGFTSGSFLSSILIGIAPRTSYYLNNRISDFRTYAFGEVSDSTFLSLEKVSSVGVQSVSKYSELSILGLKNRSDILSARNYSIYPWVLYRLEMNHVETGHWLNALILREWVGGEYFGVLDAIQIRTSTDLEDLIYDSDGKLKSDIQTNEKFNVIKSLVDIDLFASRISEQYRNGARDNIVKLKYMLEQLEDFRRNQDRVAHASEQYATSNGENSSDKGTSSAADKKPSETTKKPDAKQSKRGRET